METKTIEGIFIDRELVEEGARRWSLWCQQAPDLYTGVLSMAKGWYEKREEGWRKPVQLAAVVSIGTPNQGVQALAVSPSVAAVLI